VVVASVATAHGPVALAVIHDATRRVSGDDLLRQAREQLEGIAAERGSRLTDEGRRADGERSRLAQVQDLVSQIAAWTDQADSSRGSLHLVQPLASAVRAFERSQLLNALSSTGGRKARAAEILGISRKNLWEKLRAHGLGSSVDES
jgi:DNA-binding NtrC family response regulator